MPVRATFACLALFLATVAQAAGPESRYSSIANKDCKFDPIGDEPGEADDQLKTCPGQGGAKVLVNAFHTRLRIGFLWGRRAISQQPAYAVEAWSAGEKIEWRGLRGPKGFEPYAATVRMIAPPPGDKPKGGPQVLAVIRIADHKACLMGTVDISANKDGYELARKLADAAPSFACGQAATVLGVATEAARLVAIAPRQN